MAGNKNSGRQRNVVEAARTETKAEAIKLSWDAVVAFLKNDAIDIEKKMDVASRIAVKTMPSIVGGDKESPVPISIVNFADALKSLS